MENTKICDCPFYGWCHEPRQYVKETLRGQGHEETIEDCYYYKVIKENENKYKNVTI